MTKPEPLKKLPDNDVTLSVVAKTIAENNKITAKTNNQLEELQNWLNEQIKLFNSK
jgi:hypothetical protein